MKNMKKDPKNILKRSKTDLSFERAACRKENILELAIDRVLVVSKPRGLVFVNNALPVMTGKRASAYKVCMHMYACVYGVCMQ
jgi:hypothetical protein